MKTINTPLNCPDCGKEMNVTNLLEHPLIQQQIENAVKLKWENKLEELTVIKEEFEKEMERKSTLVMNAEAKIATILLAFSEIKDDLILKNNNTKEAWVERELKLEKAFEMVN